MARSNSRADQGDQELELGFGSVVSREARRRLLNRDGTFNVRRQGLGFWESIPLYHILLELTWPRFIALVGAFYLGLNFLFALAYTALGLGAVTGGSAVSLGGRLLEAFFFRVQTSSTLGYGGLAPNGLMANVLVTGESLAGLLSFGLVSGLMFARFARPTARILFSDVAVVAPYQGVTAFEFRDETFSQTVHARSSYEAAEVQLGARFVDMFDHDCGDGEIGVDVGKLHETRPS